MSAAPAGSRPASGRGRLERLRPAEEDPCGPRAAAPCWQWTAPAAPVRSPLAGNIPPAAGQIRRPPTRWPSAPARWFPPMPPGPGLDPHSIPFFALLPRPRLTPAAGLARAPARRPHPSIPGSGHPAPRSRREPLRDSESSLSGYRFPSARLDQTMYSSPLSGLSMILPSASSCRATATVSSLALLTSRERTGPITSMSSFSISRARAEMALLR